MGWGEPSEYGQHSQTATEQELERSQDVNAFIGKGVEFKGNINYNGTIRIDGKMEGEVSTEGCFLIGEDAVVTAKVTAGTIICKGTIIGDVVAREKVRLRAPAILNGTLTTPMLSMEEGVLFNGTVKMGNQKAGSISDDDSSASALSLA